MTWLILNDCLEGIIADSVYAFGVAGLLIAYLRVCADYERFAFLFSYEVVKMSLYVNLGSLCLSSFSYCIW